MARRRNQSNDQEISNRQSPFEESDFIDEFPVEDPDLNNEEDPDMNSEDSEESSGGHGFFSAKMTRTLIAVVIVLVVVLLVLIAARFFLPRKQNDLPNNTDHTEQFTPAPTAYEALPIGIPDEQPEYSDLPEETEAPAAVFTPIVFGNDPQPDEAEPNEAEPNEAEPNEAEPNEAEPVEAEPVEAEPVETPTPVPEPTGTPQPTDTPEPTETPLPIILTNTPTPTPTATPTPTPEPTPTPSPTPVPEIGHATTNRDANLRTSAVSSGKVIKTIKKNERVTIHSAIIDSNRNIWYFVTVDDLSTDGWMRDYVLTLDSGTKIEVTPAVPVPEDSSVSESPKEMPTLPEGVIATGRANHDANLRKIMNGTVLFQMRKGRKVDILSARTDKRGRLWYEVKPENSSKTGFVLASLINLDKGYEITAPTESTAPAAAAASQSSAAAETVETTPAPTEAPPEEAIGSGVINHDANLRKVKGGTVLTQLRKGRKVTIFAAETDKKGRLWYKVQPSNSQRIGYILSNLIDLDAPIDSDSQSASGQTAGNTAVPAASQSASFLQPTASPLPEKIQDRDIIGRAVTNRASNVRATPTANGQLVRQLSRGIDINIVGVFSNNEEVWYEIVTQSGKTHGFVRDYVLDISLLDSTVTPTAWEEGL